MNIQWKCILFEELTVHELYAIMHLRNKVFVVEQNCVFQDADFKDQYCHHLMAWDTEQNKLAAYTRLVPPGVAYREMSIGRVITSPAYRGVGLGKLLMEKSILNCSLIFGEKPIKIGAQLYLKKMYESFGFQQIGEIYDEDGIQHIHMLRN